MLSRDSFHARLLTHPRSRERLEALAEQIRAVPCFLVGGAIRDALREKPTRDFDFALPRHAFAEARNWADRCAGRYVLLDEESPTARVAFEDGMTADFTGYRAPTLLDDLRLRDFTVNAIAIGLNDLFRFTPDAPRFLDPCGGLRDLEARRLRWASPRSLTDDPLRMLRAFRFMATDGFVPEPSVVESIALNAALLRQSAWERIREEFFLTLEATLSAPTLRVMDETGLLTTFLPELAPMRGVAQNEFHHLDVWEHTLEAIVCFERHATPEVLADFAEPIQAYLESSVGQGISRRALIKFALLYHDVAKPTTRTQDEAGCVRFYGHEKIGAEMAYQAAKRLTLSNRACEMTRALIAEHLQTMHLSSLKRRSPRVYRRFLTRMGRDWIGVLLLSFADLQASRGPARTAEQRRTTEAVLREIAEFYHARILPVQERPRLLSGDDLMRLLEIPEGREVGRLLKRVEEAQLGGKVRTREDAIAYARRLHAQARG